MPTFCEQFQTLRQQHFDPLRDMLGLFAGHKEPSLEVVALATDLLAWTQTLAFDQHEPARRWAPKRLRLRILAVAGR